MWTGNEAEFGREGVEEEYVEMWERKIEAEERLRMGKTLEKDPEESENFVPR